MNSVQLSRSSSSNFPISRLPAGAAGVGDASFRLRVRALTRSRPVLDLAASSRWGDRLPDVDAIGLALAAVDLVMSRQGLPDAVTYDECQEVLARLSALGDPTHSVEDHRALAEHVLDALLNKANQQAKFEFEVGNWSQLPDELPYKRSLLEFWLLREKEDRATGQLVLHADADAINALVSGLAFDVADEQAAAELVLRRQIARGEFGKAEATASRNLQLTMQYAEELDAVLVETRRDIRSAAPRWQIEVPAKLHVARDHLKERLHEEESLLEYLRSVVDASPGTATQEFGTGLINEDGVDRQSVLAAAARASRLLEKCRERHHQLMTRVLEAIGVFLEAQQAQAFRPLGGLRIPDLGEEVLKPMLAHTPGAAETVGAAFLMSLSVSPRPMVRLCDLIDAMLSPARAEVMERGEPDPEDDGEETAAALPPELVAAARDVVAATPLPARLSTLLRTAQRIHLSVDVPEYPTDGAVQEAGLAEEIAVERVAALLTSAALWLFAPDDGEDAGAAVAYDIFGATALAAADGTPMPENLVGGPWYGDDLLIAAIEDQLFGAFPSPEDANDRLSVSLDGQETR